MIKHFFLTILLLFSVVISAQINPGFGKANLNATKKTTDTATVKKPLPKATIDKYRVITLENDTTYIDTSLTIKKLYIFNYLRRDNFGLLPFANEGQTYATLQYGINQSSPYPEFGFEAKHFNFLQANQMRYYSVATPLSELYFKSVMKQGQNLDAFATLNTSERHNFSIAYKGLRSQGKYVNQLSSTGNFRFTASYNTKDTRYFLKAHMTAQDLTNQENGGIVRPEDFEGGDPAFDDRARLQVYLIDGQSLLKGNRFFIDHHFRLHKTARDNNFTISHQSNFETKIFEYSQLTLPTTITNPDGSTTVINRFGNSYVASNLFDKTDYYRFYNKVGVNFDNKTLGKFTFFIDDYKYNYKYNSYLFIGNQTIPSAMTDRINSVGGQYKYQKGNWNGNFQYSTSVTNQGLSNLDLSLGYAFDDENVISFQVQKLNKLPNHNYNLYQSEYIAYNWFNNFKNEKINNLKFDAETSWVNVSAQYSVLNDKLYFSNNSTDFHQLLVTPKQYDGTINYFSVKANREFTFGKFALDNTLLYQKVQQSDNILNVPEFVTRNSFYFSDDVFKKAMFIQTGLTFNYFTKHYANDYNPLIGEFYVQDKKKIGSFPMFDLFLNGRVRQTRIYLIAEHFNSLFSTRDYYSAPNYPYRDFTIRFGLVWVFFR